MVRRPSRAVIGRCVPVTLEQRVQELANHFEREAAEDRKRADGGIVEASYYYGLAAAFGVVAAMLREALVEAQRGDVER